MTGIPQTIATDLHRELYCAYRGGKPSQFDLARIMRKALPLKTVAIEEYYDIAIACAAASGDLADTRRLFGIAQGVSRSSILLGNYLVSLKILGATDAVREEIHKNSASYRDDLTYLGRIGRIAIECGLYETALKSFSSAIALGGSVEGEEVELARRALELISAAEMTEVQTGECAALLLKTLLRFGVYLPEHMMIPLSVDDGDSRPSIVARYVVEREFDQVMEIQNAVFEAFSEAELPAEMIGLWVPMLVPSLEETSS